MSQKTLNQLPAETVKVIASTQIITSVSTAVKELIENSLDAEARNIQVKLDNYGFDILEVKDDGHGISYTNVQRMFLSGYTSKIASFNDLGRLQTYGFRGEALSALAKLSNVTVTTKTCADTLAMTYVISHDGIPKSSKPNHLTKGTVITAANIFSNLPVRKQYLSSKKKASEELKKVEYVVQSLSVIHPELRVALFHNKCQIWQKNSVKGFKQSLMQVVGLKVVSKMDHLNELGNNTHVDLIIPKKKLDNIDNVFTNSSQSIFLYVNKRPVVYSKLSKVVMEHVFLHYAHLTPAGKYAMCLISVEVPTQEIDVNLEPNKTKIYLKNEADVLNLIDQMLSSYYEQTVCWPDPEMDEPEDKLSDEHNLDEENTENYQRKSLHLENEECSNRVIMLSDSDFSDKNDRWQLEVITSDNLPQKKEASSLCSQINTDNCTLTSIEEVGELKKLLNDGSKLLVTSVNVDLQPKLSHRDELQNYKKLKCVDSAKQLETAVGSEKGILPSWPVRQVPETTTKSKNIEHDSFSDVIQDVRDVGNEKDLDFFDNIDIRDWSKGSVETGGGILPNGVVLARSVSVTNEVTVEDMEQFDLSMRSVSSQMGEKELSGFTKFARIMRPKILKEFPGMIFTKVAGMLVDRWKALPPDDKKYYEKLAKAVNLKREIHLENKTLDEYKTVKSPPAKKKKDMKPERYELKTTTTVQNIFQKWNRRGVYNPVDAIQLVGQLQPSGNWLYKKGNEIGHVRHSGLQELILSQKMLSSHSVPRQPVPKEILINESILGKELWDTLVDMEVEFDPVTCRYTLVSGAVSKNGFKIDLEKEGDAFALGWITEVASMIPFYGVAELRETLNLYRAKGEFADLGSLRSSAVINYIANEVIRIVQQTPRPPDLTDIKEMIDTWQMCLNHLQAQCLHFRDIFAPFYHLTEC